MQTDMQSEFAAEAFIRDGWLLQAADVLRAEATMCFEDALRRLKGASTLEGVPDVLNAVEELQCKVLRLAKCLHSHKDKLGMRVEMSLPMVVALDKDEEWVKPVTVKSAMDVISFVNAKLGRTQQQEAALVSIIKDLLKPPVSGSS